MNRSSLSRPFLTVVCLLVASCGTMDSNEGSATTRNLKFQNDVTVGEVGGSKTPVKKGDVMPMPKGPLQVEAPGYVGVVVLPVPSKPGEVDISLKPVDEFGGPQFSRTVNQRLNETISRVVEAQKLLASGKARDALSIIETLQSKAPELTYLNFLKASCLVVLGERERARAALSVALDAFPDNEAGRALAATMKMEPARGNL